jgi:hypothetical protein
MKKLCFIEMEGVLSSKDKYISDSKKVSSFLTELTKFCKSNKVELYLVSAYHEPVAKNKFLENKFDKFFDEGHFLCVSEEYISSKPEADKKLHKDNLEKDKGYLDNYHKQVVIMNLLKEKDLHPKDALLLSDDVWVDGYYTNRFSKIDFAIFEENVVDRGNLIERISGLAYFNLDFATVKLLIENFPPTSDVALEKYVFDVMKKVLVGDKVKDIARAAISKRLNQNN